ncbi:methyltransferase domain-containing protein [Patescibacteria group bacterium]|nr:methyltransferase domain-containing protein [Patescibacteria group bacterium]
MLMGQEGVGDKTVLDVGCGYGFYSFIAERLGARKVVGVDFSEQMIKQALEFKRIRDSRVNFSLGAVEQLPFAPNTFDMVISGMALNLNDFNAGCTELQRVLKRNGSIIFSVPHPIGSHGEYNGNGEFTLGGYFTRKEHVEEWQDELGNPVKFARGNRTIEDYTEGLYHNGFAVVRLFESRPITTPEDNDQALVDKMMEVPDYLIILARRLNLGL